MPKFNNNNNNNKVSHKKLCDKLAMYGIRGKTLEWIIDFLSHRTQKVLVGGKISDPVAKCYVWRPSGHCSGPLTIHMLH